MIFSYHFTILCVRHDFRHKYNLQFMLLSYGPVYWCISKVPRPSVAYPEPHSATPLFWWKLVHWTNA